jgi:hypothetical protein
MSHTQRIINRFKEIKNRQVLLDVLETHGSVQRRNFTKKSETSGNS